MVSSWMQRPMFVSSAWLSYLHFELARFWYQGTVVFISWIDHAKAPIPYSYQPHIETSAWSAVRNS